MSAIGKLNLNGTGYEFATPTDEQTQTAVDAWLDDHPEATTTVQDDSLTTEKYKDGSITAAKFSTDAENAIYNAAFKSSLGNMTVLQQDTFYKITDADNHIAFPSVLYDSQLYMAYRQGTTHLSYDGIIKIMTGTATELADFRTLSVGGGDCRDPKLIKFNSVIYCLFTARFEGADSKAYMCDLTHSGTPAVILDGYFIGGQPLVSGNLVYIPCYRGTSVYIAYGTDLSNLTIKHIADNGNECAIARTTDKFIIVYRDSDDTANGHIIRTASLDNFDVYDLPFNCHCPCLYNVDNKFILLASRSNNAVQNVNNFSGELDIYTITMAGDLQTHKVNLFAGNNTDMGYVSMCMQGTTLIIAYYMYFAKSIYVLTLPAARWQYHQMYGDVCYRTIARQTLNFPTTVKKYTFTAPLGVARIINVMTSIPSDTPATLNGAHIYIRTFYERSILYDFIGATNMNLAVDGRLICLQNKFNGVNDYNAANLTDGSFVEA